MLSPLLVLHGFNSSPNSEKARQLSAAAAQRGISCHIPQLPGDVAAAIDMLNQWASQQADFCVFGSSLGGFYASYLAGKYGVRSVVVNPSCKPYQSLERYRGDNTHPYTGEQFTLGDQQVALLKQIDQTKLAPLDTMLIMVQEGDEVLDYKQALTKYAGANLLVEPGGNHRFEGFENHIDRVFKFLYL